MSDLPPVYDPGQPPLANVVLARPVQTGLSATTNPLLLGKLSHAAAVTDLALIVVLLLGVPLVLDLLMALEAVDMDETAWLDDFHEQVFAQLFIILYKWAEVILASAVAVMLLWFHKLSPASYGVNFRRPLRQLAWALGTLAGVYAVMAITVMIITPLMLANEAVEEDVMQRMEFLDVLPTEEPALAFLLLLPVAIHEELLFRGLLIPYLRRISGSAVLAVFISTGVFAALHWTQGWVGVVQVFFLGLTFAVFFLRTRSLMPVILAHLAFDMLQLQLMRFLLPITNAASQPT